MDKPTQTNHYELLLRAYQELRKATQECATTAAGTPRRAAAVDREEKAEQRLERLRNAAREDLGLDEARILVQYAKKDARTMG